MRDIARILRESTREAARKCANRAGKDSGKKMVSKSETIKNSLFSQNLNSYI